MFDQDATTVWFPGTPKTSWALVQLTLGHTDWPRTFIHLCYHFTEEFYYWQHEKYQLSFITIRSLTTVAFICNAIKGVYFRRFPWIHLLSYWTGDSIQGRFPQLPLNRVAEWPSIKPQEDFFQSNQLLLSVDGPVMRGLKTFWQE